MLETVWYELVSRSGGWLSVLALGALKAAAILVIAGIVAFALRGASAAVRHQVWLVGVVCALAVPLAAAVLPEIRVPGPAWLAAGSEGGKGWSVGLPAMEIEAMSEVAEPAEVAIAPLAKPAEVAIASLAGNVARVEVVAARAGARAEAVAARLAEVSARAEQVAARAELAAAAAASRMASGLGVAGDPVAVVAAPTPVAVAPSVSVIAIPRTPPPPVPAPAAFDVPPGAPFPPFGSPWALALIGLWLFGVWIVTSGIVAGALRVAWLGWQARPVTTGRCARLATVIGEEVGVPDVRVLLGPSTAMPMTWGLFRPTVLLPEGAESWPIDQLDAALRHELAHARRRDTLTQLVADILCAIHWFNPLAWLAAHRLRVEREHACDDEVLASGSKPSDYATQLLDMTRALRAARLTAMAAIPMARPSQLRDRLEAVLDDDRARGGLSRPARTRGWAAGFLVALPFALLGFTPMSSWAVGDDFDYDYDYDYDFDFDYDYDHGADEALAHAAPVPHRRGMPVPTAVPGLPGPRWQDCTRRRDRAGYSVEIHDEEQRIEWYADGCRRTVEIDGTVTFDDAFRRIVALSPGGSVRIEAEVGGGERRLELEEVDDDIAYAYFVDGAEQPFDDDASAWLDDVVLEMLRIGYMAEERAPALLQTGGVDLLLEEAAWLQSDFARRTYYAAALAAEDVRPDQAVEVIERAGAEIHSDFDLAELLVSTVDDRPFTGAIADAFLAASHSISSDFDHRRVLTEVLTHGALSVPQQAAFVESAAELRSDFDKAELLVAFVAGEGVDAEVQPAYIDVAASIRSDHDRRRALDALLAQGRLDDGVVAEVIRAAADLRSDFDKAEALLHVARTQTLDEASRAEFLAAVETIRSDFDQERAGAALRTPRR